MFRHVSGDSSEGMLQQLLYAQGCRVPVAVHVEAGGGGGGGGWGLLQW